MSEAGTPRSVRSGSRGAIVVGASSGVGRAIAEGLAEREWDLVVAARSRSELEELARDLAVGRDIAVTAVAVDVTDAGSLTTFVETVDTAMPDPDAVIVTVGSVAPVDEGLTDWATTDALVAANLTGVIKLAGHFAVGFEARDRGTLVLFSSIAAGAPRRNNVAYAAAKAGLESFGASLQHRFGRSSVSVQVYRLGYVDTRLARGQDLKLPPADPRKVATRVIEGLDDGSRTVHEPRYWGALVRALRLLPAPIYNRLDF